MALTFTLNCSMADVTVPADLTVAGDQVTAPDAVPSTVDGVASVWTQVLGLETVDPDASFFDLGGDSISSSYVVHRLERIFGVELDVLSIFDYDTPAALARHIEDVLAEQPAATVGTRAPGLV